MTFNYNGLDIYNENIRLRSATDQVKGGLDNPANVASQDLADNTAYLKAQDVRDMTNQVEAASGGTATVRQDAGGFIDYFHIMEKFKPSDIDADLGDYTGLFAPAREYHPAFYVNAVLKDRILVSIFTGDLETANAVDYLTPSINRNPILDEYSISQIRLLCSNKGTGYHLMNYLEYAALGILSLDVVGRLKGNDSNGKSLGGSVNGNLRGRPYSTGGLTYAGSGPLEWRHNHKPFGVADLVGNVAQVLDGIYVDSGQLYMFSTRDNNYTESEASYTATGIYYNNHLGSIIQLHNSVVTSTPDSVEFQNMLISATLKAASNVLIDSSYITDCLMSKQWNQASTLITPAIIGTNNIGSIYAETLVAKAYLLAGGAYNSTSGEGEAGLATRYFETDSSVLHGRCCLIE
jgi:hypothetical protein